MRIGETVVLAYADQSRTLDGEKTVWEEISGGADHLTAGQSPGQLPRLRGLVQLQRVRTSRSWSTDLSGGERNRVHLAKTLKRGGQRPDAG
jgi:energy-dependent translational throttle protein EttA